MKGFFSQLAINTDAVPLSMIPACGACGLLKKCLNPKMPVSGKGRKKILIVGEAPGENEDMQNKQFVGKTGQYLEKVLSAAGINMRQDCWLTNSLICRPPRNIISDVKMIDYCRPNLIKTIEELKPEIIIPLGASAVKSLIGWVWQDDVKGISRWIGWKIPCQKLNAWICPAWHPSFVVRTDYGNSGLDRNKGNDVREMIFAHHIKEAVSLVGTRPEKHHPGEIHVLMNPDDAIPFLEDMCADEWRTPLTFDYETDRLKPDHPDASIICCSFSNGYKSIAFPWIGKVIQKVKAILLDKGYKKIGYSAKFEDRWTRRVFGKGVRNWIWDGMLAAHTLDSRKGITGLKFQSFVLLGVSGYNDYVKPFMKSETSNSPNRLRDANLTQVLKYCAMDSLYEWQVAQIQAKQLGVQL